MVQGNSVLLWRLSRPDLLMENEGQSIFIFVSLQNSISHVIFIYFKQKCYKYFIYIPFKAELSLICLAYSLSLSSFFWMVYALESKSSASQNRLNLTPDRLIKIQINLTCNVRNFLKFVRI